MGATETRSGGNCQYGYSHRLVPDPQEQEVLSIIAEMRNRNVGTTKIARELADAGIRNRAGGKFSPQAIAHILQAPAVNPDQPRTRGRAPYGWQFEAKVNPAEQAVLRAIRSMRDDGLTYGIIAEKLNADDSIPQPRLRSKWTEGAVCGAMLNRVKLPRFGPEGDSESES